MPRISKVAHQNIHAPSWEADDYITLKTAPTGFDLESIESARRRYLNTADGNPETVEVQITPQHMNTAKLECAVIGGTFRDEDGHILPYTPELLGRLSPEDRRFVVGEIDALWAPWLAPLVPAPTPEAQADADFRGKPLVVARRAGKADDRGDAAATG